MSNQGKPDAGTRRATILLACDGDARDALGRALKGEYEVLAAQDTATAATLLDANDCINLVIDGLKANGTALLAHIRAHTDARISGLPVLAAVDDKDAGAKQQALAAGANDLATLPIDPPQLLARARSYVQLDQAARALREGVADDPLTGVASRRYFLLKGAQDVALALRHQESLSILFVEIDRIRKIYGEHGEEAADALVVWAARLLKKNCRQEDTVARVGGSEFAVLAPRTDGKQALQVYERLRAAAATDPLQHRGKALNVTFSAGVAVFGVDPELDIEGLLRLAGERTAVARKSGNLVIGPAGMETAVGAEPASTRPKPKPKASPGGTPVDIETALTLLAANQEERVRPQAAQLLLRVVPLLELGNRELNLGLGFAINAMQKRIQMLMDDEALSGNQ